MTADDGMKSWCANSGMKGQVRGFQNPGVCLQAFPSFSSPLTLALFYLLYFSSGNSLLPNPMETLAVHV